MEGLRKSELSYRQASRTDAKYPLELFPQLHFDRAISLPTKARAKFSLPARKSDKLITRLADKASQTDDC